MGVSILIGDVRDMLRELPDDHFDCVVTSPPYWGLRDYGVDGQIGLEPTIWEHLDVMVEVFEEVKRVLKPTGTLWLNYGDCYAGSWGAQSRGETPGPKSKLSGGQVHAAPKGVHTGSSKRTPGLKAKDLCMVPNRLAIALQEAGWWVRSEIIWAKPNPMPESIKDRPAGAHEKIFMLSKRPTYFYDAAAVRRDRVSTGAYKTPDGWDTGPGGHGSHHRAGRQKGESVADKRAKVRAADVAGPRHAGHVNHTGIEGVPRGEGRSLRNYEPAPLQVWRVATRPFSQAHFATFPPELAERCLLAGCPKGGEVLDPFGGAGTTGLVAAALGLDCTLIELNPEYAKIAARRLRAGLARVEGVDHVDDAGPLFAGAAA